MLKVKILFHLPQKPKISHALYLQLFAVLAIFKDIEINCVTNICKSQKHCKMSIVVQ